MQTPRDLAHPSLVQNIGDVSARNGAQVVAGNVRGDLYQITIINPNSADGNAAKSCEKALFQTFSAVEPSGLERRVPGTCEWIREHPTYQTWLENSCGRLWICGSPGKGKTMLSLFLSEELEILSKDSEGSDVICYFCSGQDSKRNNATSILRGLLWQMVIRRPEYATYMISNFDTEEKARESVSSPDILWSIFVKVIQSSKSAKTFCVLDGLDECDEQSQRWFVAKINGLGSSASTLQLVIVSRDILYLRGSDTQIKLDPDNDDQIKKDIEKFISTKMQELSTMVGLSLHFQRAIEQKLLNGSEGTFLWVGLAMSELFKKKTATEIEQTLLSLPAGLPGIYRQMLVQIEDDHKEQCSKMLRWIAVAVRPLSLLELAAAIGTKRTPLISLEEVIRDQITMCGFIIKDVGFGPGLVHQSAKDYLLCRGAEVAMFLKDFCIEPKEAHLLVARTCLDIICQSNLQDAPMEEHREQPFVLQDYLRGQHRLLPYAVYSWIEHATYEAGVAEELIRHPSGFFNKESKVRDEWWRVYCGVKQLHLPTLHMACYLGVAPWARIFIERDRLKLKLHRMLNKSDSEGLKPLHHAVRQGHLSTVQTLLDCGADISVEGPFGWASLDYASEKGQLEMVQLLVNRGANVNANSRPSQISQGTALIKAAANGHESVVRFLLDSGAFIDSKTLRGHTALCRAAFHGHGGVVWLLSDRGADINVKAEFGCAPLHDAACHGNEAMTRFLLDRGADIDIKTDYGWTALREAAYNDHWNIIQLLLERGACVDPTTQESIDNSQARRQNSDLTDSNQH